MNLIPCGSKAKTKVGEIEGIITAISIRFDRASYEFSYFTATDYKTCWLNESEFHTEVKERNKIGFRK